RDAAPREAVRALTADLHRRRGGDRQLDLAAEARERPFELALRRHPVLRQQLALRVAGRRRPCQVDVGDVALVQTDEAWSQSSCRTGQLYQKASGERVEGPGVPGARAGPPPQLAYERERRASCRLVD